MSFDTSDFDKKFKRITQRQIPDLAEKGMGRALLNLMNDCIMEVPTVPLKEGFLRGSASIFVNNKLVGVSQHGQARYATNVASMTIPHNSMLGVVGFNAPYAARLHEGVDFMFTEPSSGPKFLESKIQKNRKHYLETIANTIKGGA